MADIGEILTQLKKDNVTWDVLCSALKIADRNEFMPVFEYSEEICERYFDKGVFIRGIIEFSNICAKNCFYCGIRRDNKKIVGYTMTKDEIMETVDKIYAQGIYTVVLQSGENKGNDDFIIDIIKSIKEKYDMAVTLSVGEKDEQTYVEFKKAGVDRYLLRIETTDPLLYKRYHPDSLLAERIERLYALKKLGFEVGTGIMVGLPGQSIESIAEDIMFFKRLDPSMVGIGPFLPHSDTPLNNEQSQDIFLTLKTMALIRIVLKNVNLPATTAMGTLDVNGRIDAMKYGANVFMPNFTPKPYRENYLLYDNKVCVSEECSNACADEIVKVAGKFIVKNKGSYLSKIN